MKLLQEQSKELNIFSFFPSIIYTIIHRSGNDTETAPTLK